MKILKKQTINKNGKKITNNPTTGKITIEEKNKDTIRYNWCVLGTDGDNVLIKTGIDITTVNLDEEEEINPARYERIMTIIKGTCKAETEDTKKTDKKTDKK